MGGVQAVCQCCLSYRVELVADGSVEVAHKDRDTHVQCAKLLPGSPKRLSAKPGRQVCLARCIAVKGVTLLGLFEGS